MRSGMKMLLAFMVAGGIAACDTRDDMDTFETDAPATPAAETAPAERNAVITADIDALDDAEGFDEVDGEVRIYEAMGMTGTTGTTPRTGDAADRTATTRDAAATSRSFQIELEVTGLPQGAEYAWDIRAGDCDEHGQVVANLIDDAETGARALTPGVDGRAMGTATVAASHLTLEQLEEEDHALFIHSSADGAGTPVACANLDSGLGVF